MTLSVCFLLYNCGARLHSLVARARTYADAIVLGVDDSSDPLTIDLAHRLGDIVFLWPHTPFENTFRLELVLHATTDWVLILDDDEALGGDPYTFRTWLDLTTYSHAWLARCWVNSLDPLTYFDESPWWPDWQLRVIRRDAPSIAHSDQPHSVYQVSGECTYLTQWPIWHYDRVMRTAPEREVKLARYREQGMTPGGTLEQYYVGAGRTAALPPEAHPEFPFLHQEVRHGQ